jgi:glucose-1-phosphate cytidylyltransferase
MTGGRIKRIKKYVMDEPFFVTYGDGLSDINIKELLDYHLKHNKVATLSAVQPEGRFGVIEANDNNEIVSFREKNKSDSGWINGGFMVFNPEMIDYIENDMTILENEPFTRLVNDNQLVMKKHYGFWQCMDTLRDKEKLEELWESGKSPWKVWK